MPPRAKKTEPMHLGNRIAAWNRAGRYGNSSSRSSSSNNENQGAASSSSTSSSLLHKNPVRSTPFVLPELRTILVRHMNGPTLRSAFASHGFPEARAERAERVKAYNASEARKNYEEAHERAENYNYDNFVNIDNTLVTNYGRNWNETGPEHKKLVDSLWHEKRKHGGDHWETEKYYPAYRANKAARAHAALPRRFLSRAQKTALQNERGF